MTALPTLGGNNSFASGVNNRGQIVGGAETSAKGHRCDKPQRFDYCGVIWQPDGTTLTLPPYPGDTISFATGADENGDVVGFFGRCGPLNDALIARHALLWQSGSTIDLGNLGGTANNVRLRSITGVRSWVIPRSRKRDVACFPLAERRDERPRHAARRRL